MIDFIKKRQNIIFPFLDIALNGVNYFYHILISWYLIPHFYGILNSLLSLSSILIVSGVSFQTYTAKIVSEKDFNKKKLSNIFKIALVFSVITLIIILIFLNKIREITRGTLTEILLVILIFLLNLLLSIFRGIFQGNREFLSLNFSFYIEVLSKIFFLISFIKIYHSIIIGLVSILIGMFVSLIHSIYKNKKFIKNLFDFEYKTNKNISETFFNILKIYSATFSFYFFTSIDMIIVNYYIPSKSGIYAVILKYSQISTFIAISIITVFIPILNNQKNNKKEFKQIILKLFSIILGIGVIGLGLYYTVVPYTVKIFFGEKYMEASNYLFIGLIPYVFLVLTYLVINIHIILGNTKYIFSLILGVVAITCILNFYHKNIETIFYAQTIFYLVLFIILSIQLLIDNNLNVKDEGIKNDI